MYFEINKAEELLADDKVLNAVEEAVGALK